MYSTFCIGYFFIFINMFYVSKELKNFLTANKSFQPLTGMRKNYNFAHPYLNRF